VSNFAPTSYNSEAAAGGAPLISLIVPVYKVASNIRPFLNRTEPILERPDVRRFLVDRNDQRDQRCAVGGGLRVI